MKVSAVSHFPLKLSGKMFFFFNSPLPASLGTKLI